MGKKKTKRRSKANALSPIDKQGIKLATLLSEIGLAAEVGSTMAEHSGDFGESAQRLGTRLLDLSRPGTKIMWTGVALKVLGRFVPQVRNLGVIGLR